MKKKFLIGPIPILVISIIAAIAALGISVNSSLEFDEKLKVTIERFKISDQALLDTPSETSLVLTVTFFVIAVIGMAMIFVYYQKTQKLYQMQENFISNFTHELKTPVASIKLYLETLKRRDVSPEKRAEFVDFMLRDTERLHSNINQILQTSKVESKDSFFQTEDIELSSYIDNLALKIDHLFKDQIIFNNELKGEVFTRINSELFESLLINLISNGLKYNESSGPKVTISFQASIGQIQIDIEDNGIGIEDKNIKRVFDKFYRVQDQGKLNIKGTGLGLYLVSQIVSLHKGKISARNKGSLLEQTEGSGSCFSVVLPRFYPARIPKLKAGATT